eukprot:TRINITY_DN29459_c0_g1_i1.p1 TRINITY_DN29459_c0_g1~~TRINITY_DN29459_c0_g1_i1.p1  ORF type:complete len:490 (+),score=59.22 TRINITY_DN29459_c0_g1_i1:153-1622(+)
MRCEVNSSEPLERFGVMVRSHGFDLAAGRDALASGLSSLVIAGHKTLKMPSFERRAGPDGHAQVLTLNLTQMSSRFFGNLEDDSSHGRGLRASPAEIPEVASISRNVSYTVGPMFASTSTSLARSEPSLQSIKKSADVSRGGRTCCSGVIEDEEEVLPSASDLVFHPIAAVHLVPKDVAMFIAGAVAGALAKTITAPLDRVKLLAQVQGVQAGQPSLNLFDAMKKIGREEGLVGYWRGNLPQVLRVIPYSAVQLLAYESYKRLFTGKERGATLSVPARLAAGACAGMTSTLVTYPLDVLRLRLAVDPASRSMSKVALRMLREEGAGSFFRGLGPSLLGIAPYIAINFCAFDLIKKALPEDFQRGGGSASTTAKSSFLPALLAAAIASVSCYPLDTVRRQLQMKGTPFKSVADAVPGIIARDGVAGLYRGFFANVLKNLPNSSIRLTTYDAAKTLVAASHREYDRLKQQKQRTSVRAEPLPLNNGVSQAR